MPRNPQWAAYFYVSDVDTLATEYRKRDVDILCGPEDALYGCREIDIRNPDGHIICFGQDLNEGPEGPGL